MTTLIIVNKYDVVNCLDVVNRSDVYWAIFLWHYGGMGKAGKVLRQVLEEYEVSQYSLAAALDIERNTVYRWVNEKSDPSGETILDIVRVLKTLKPEAAKAFVELYLGNEISDL